MTAGSLNLLRNTMRSITEESAQYVCSSPKVWGGGGDGGESRAEESRAEQSRRNQSRGEETRAEQNRAEQKKAEQSRAEQNRTEQSRRKQSRRKQSRAEQSRARNSTTVGGTNATKLGSRCTSPTTHVNGIELEAKLQGVLDEALAVLEKDAVLAVAIERRLFKPAGQDREVFSLCHAPFHVGLALLGGEVE